MLLDADRIYLRIIGKSIAGTANIKFHDPLIAIGDTPVCTDD
jgi:hypothetical protein